MTLRSSWNLAKHLVDEMWSRWLSEYLPVISRTCKQFDYVRDLTGAGGNEISGFEDELSKSLWERMDECGKRWRWPNDQQFYLFSTLLRDMSAAIREENK